MDKNDKVSKCMWVANMPYSLEKFIYNQNPKQQQLYKEGQYALLSTNQTWKRMHLQIPEQPGLLIYQL